MAFFYGLCADLQAFRTIQNLILTLPVILVTINFSLSFMVLLIHCDNCMNQRTLLEANGVFVERSNLK